MYGSIRRYRIRTGTVDEIVAKVKEGLLPILEKTPGFGGYFILNAESNRATSFTIGDDRAAVENMNRIALDWVKANMPDRLSEPEVLSGPMPVALIHQHV